jgi:hypothetical protein
LLVQLPGLPLGAVGTGSLLKPNHFGIAQVYAAVMLKTLFVSHVKPLPRLRTVTNVARVIKLLRNNFSCRHVADGVQLAKEASAEVLCAVATAPSCELTSRFRLLLLLLLLLLTMPLVATVTKGQHRIKRNPFTISKMRARSKTNC